MFDLFSSREIATGLWILFFIIYIFSVPKIRKSAMNLVKSAITPKLFVPFVILSIYTSVFTLFLTFLPEWSNRYIKDIVLWVLFAGVPIYYGTISKEVSKGYFLRNIIDSVKFVAVLEFIISTFTFNIVVEIIIIPVLLFFSLSDVIFARSPGLENVRKLILSIQSIIGFSFLGFSLVSAIESYYSINEFDLIYSFTIPIMMSLALIPASYVFGIYAKYELLFLNMRFKEPDDKKVRRLHRIKTFKACGLSFNRVRKFNIHIQKMYIRMSEAEFDSIIAKFIEELTLSK